MEETSFESAATVGTDAAEEEVEVGTDTEEAAEEEEEMKFEAGRVDS